jgi:SAM-dependent methyltransferase
MRADTHGTGGATVASDDEFRPPDHVLRKLRESRRHPRWTQFDYLHVRYLIAALSRAFRDVRTPVRDVLDIYCGTRPYDDLLPAGSRSVGMDISNFAGVADVVTTEFLPFDDESFDLVMCIEAFYYVPDLAEAVAEIARVLRPDGTAVITVSLPWEYDRGALERRYTGPQLLELFRDWREPSVVENGGFAVSWATLTGRIVYGVEEHAPRAVRTALRPFFAGAYLLINAIGACLDWVERRRPPETHVLPMNLMLTARRPARGEPTSG